jgi:FkbM family methyltransferase
MDSLDLISSKKKDNFPLNKNENKVNKFIKYILILLILSFFPNIYTSYSIFKLNKKVNIVNINTSKNYQKYDNEIDNESNINKIIPFVKDNNIEEYIKIQKNFCNYPDKFYFKKYEELIQLTEFSLRNISFQMYTYKRFLDGMSKEIIDTSKYEPMHISNFLDALKYYGEKKNIKKNEDIFMLDIGGNLGVYPTFLGKFGYSIITFEASPRNSYIIYKNYCSLNNNSNIIIINKGLSNVEKTCSYYSQISAIGNGMVLCDEKEERTNAGLLFLQKEFEVKITKLSKFLPYLSSKNIALIKLDIEGGEGKVIEDAIELINKYHVPFIFTEFDPDYLNKQGTDPKKYLELFTNNGYKISFDGFLNKNYVNPKDINSGHNNLYFIYSEN